MILMLRVRNMLSGPGIAVQWAGQLGDGRAISLGQAIGPDGTPYELQLKVRVPSYPSGPACLVMYIVSIRSCTAATH